MKNKIRKVTGLRMSKSEIHEVEELSDLTGLMKSAAIRFAVRNTLRALKMANEIQAQAVASAEGQNVTSRA